ncbi:hypothetical protein ACHAWF_006066 [Thalassiosira exigua]
MGNVESAPRTEAPPTSDGASSREGPPPPPPPTPGSSLASSSSSQPSPPAALARKPSGLLLAEPVTSKLTERGEASTFAFALPHTDGKQKQRPPTTAACASDDDENKLRYAASGMQGWRSHMEDAHVLNPSLYVNRRQQKLLEDHHLFAVFDGHGGDFASHFCGEHLASTLVSQRDWRAYLRLLASDRAEAEGGSAPSSSRPSKRDSVAGISLLKSALASTFLALDQKLMEAQRARRVAQLSHLEDAVYNLSGACEQDVFQEGTEDREKVLNFDRRIVPSMPARVSLERSGSTGVVVLIAPRHVLCANAGDSRAVLCRKKERPSAAEDDDGDDDDDASNGCVALPLSFDHKPSNDAERWRVERDGGFVRAGRVDGDLAVSRSFGDFGYKLRPVAESRDDDDEEATKGAVSSSRSSTSSSSTSRLSPRPREEARRSRVTACPDILVHARDNLRDEFVILACDGVWDVLGNRACVSLIRSLMRDDGETDAGLACEEVLDAALELDSKDNMTCCLVVFPPAGTGRRGRRSGRGAAAGVLGRRRDRARARGRDSTPAGRARARAEERKRKERRRA